ncbi:unnamed protein product [Adineta steineri]|uniref:GIY-YIG domain-containing protein n=1 Tax=Adineta steineri TaxID=433720 RepID=A0A819S1D9_9BILA|nr:unnamed protein product [Adineta steineri]
MEILDLSTRNVDSHDASVVSKDISSISTSLLTDEKFLNLNHRLSILPLYPTSNTQAQSHPLLTNIPYYQLSQADRIRRHSSAFKPAFNILNLDPTIPSFLREKYQFFYGDLIERLKVDITLLDFNYTRLEKYMKALIDQHIRVFDLRPYEIQRIDEKEYPLALEFFLQFDVNMFYMKTCSFRFARPRSLNEGLFCLQEPEARYELAACGNCGLCYPQYDMIHRSKNFVVEFSQAHRHTFVNGYNAILNCSASCHTQNIIYTLTCPCGKVDYVGTTMQSLYDRLQKHREHGNRIMHEFLLGQSNIMQDSPQGKTKPILRKDRMKLYQHSARCPAAMQIFLDAYPQYWRFIPMTFEESEKSEQRNINDSLLSDEVDCKLRSKEKCRICVEAVPKPPRGLIFSNRQILLQAQYFQKKRDKIVPDGIIDLYNATIVAVLPDSCSEMFRYTLESLFITYGNTSLNTIGNVLNEDQQSDYYRLDNPWLIRGDEWCQGLVRRPQPKTNYNLNNN